MGILNNPLWAKPSSGAVSVTITQPLSGSQIANNSTSVAITGVASTSNGTITGLAWSVDGGAYTNFSFSAAAAVNFNGGQAGLVGGGNHTVTVRATNSAAVTSSTSSSYYIVPSAPAASYSWTPANVYNGNPTFLSISNATHNAAVSYTQNIYSAQGALVSSQGSVSIGSTDGNGALSFTGAAAWGINTLTSQVSLTVGGGVVAVFYFYNKSANPSASYGPSIAPTGTTISLSLGGQEGSATVAQTTTYSPSGTIVGQTTLGSTDANGGFSYSGTSTWGSDTSAVVNVFVDNANVGSFSFTKT